jgi:CRISPR-associated protein Cas2
MVVLICYDVSTATSVGKQRLRKVADICENHGVRVQYSVFECPVSPSTWLALRHQLLKTFHGNEDSLRFYFLEGGCESKTEHHGVRRPLDLRGALVF